MADFTITDFSRGAQNSVQTGLAYDIYFFLQSEAHASTPFTFDATTREVTAITMATGNQAYKVEANIEEGLIDNPLSGGTGTFGVQTLTFALDGLTSANKKALDTYDKNTGLCALVILANGTRRLLGIDFDTTDSNDNWYFVPKFNAGGDTSGTISDSSTTVTNRKQRTYTWNANNTAPYVSTSLDLSTLTTAAA